MHPSTFEYLKPTNLQIEEMAHMRAAFAAFTNELVQRVPDGPDLDYVLRLLRTAAMWTNVAITREADGAPRV